MPSSGGYLVFSEAALDLSKGFYDASSGTFKSPVDGLYQFDLQMATNNNYKYLIQLQVDGRVVDKLSATPYSNARGEHSNFMSTEISLKQGENLRLYVDYMYSGMETTNNCFIDGQETGCSFFQGKLLERYNN